MPIEIDLDIVRRQRERGLLGLGQPLKSFRDCKVDFTVYDRERFDHGYLEGLGPLEKPGRAETPSRPRRGGPQSRRRGVGVHACNYRSSHWLQFAGN